MSMPARVRNARSRSIHIESRLHLKPVHISQRLAVPLRYFDRRSISFITALQISSTVPSILEACDSNSE